MQLEKIHNTAPKIPELVMNSILNAIDSGQIRLNEDLLPERELAAALGVGRGSLRECLAILEFLGVIESRGNRKVVAKTSDYIQKAISFIRLSERDDIMEDFSEFRRTMEVAIVELACDRATPEDIARLQETVDRMEQDPTDHEADAVFHTYLAVASHNALFAASMDLVNSLIMDLRARFCMLSGYQEITMDSHSNILQAIRVKDKERAKGEMIRHLSNIEQFAVDPNFASMHESDE